MAIYRRYLSWNKNLCSLSIEPNFWLLSYKIRNLEFLLWRLLHQLIGRLQKRPHPPPPLKKIIKKWKNAGRGEGWNSDLFGIFYKLNLKNFDGVTKLQKNNISNQRNQNMISTEENYWIMIPSILTRLINWTPCQTTN